MIAQVDSSYVRARPWKLWSRLVSYAFFEGRPLTTRGRWFNHVVFANLALARRLPKLRQVERPVFILGTGRSGTTVLGIVLSMHRDVGYLNEPKALWHRIHPAEDLIGSYSSGPASYRLLAEDATDDAIRAARHMYSTYLLFSMSRRVVDKYPELVFRVPFVKALFPDAKFLFLVRNGWDTVASIESWSGRHGEVVDSAIHDWWGADRRKWKILADQLVPEHADLAANGERINALEKQTDMAAVEWILTMREGLRVMADYPQDFLRVDYEALCRSPGDSWARICEFAGLRVDDTARRYAESILKPNTPRGPVPLDPALVQPFHQTMEALGYAA